MESKSVVVGGGCVEAALSIYLENFATSLSSREQLAIADFAKSLLVIPKVTYANTCHIFDLRFIFFFYLQHQNCADTGITQLL
jgi:hypothetical protein